MADIARGADTVNLQEHFRLVSWSDVWGCLEHYLVEDSAWASEISGDSIRGAIEVQEARYKAAYEDSCALSCGQVHDIVWVGQSVYPGVEGTVAYVVDLSDADPIDVGDLAWEHVLSCEVSDYSEAVHESCEIVAATLRGLCRFGYSAEEAKRRRESRASELKKRLLQSEEQLAEGECSDSDAALDELRRTLGLRPSTPESRAASRYRVDEETLVSLVRRREMSDVLEAAGWVGFSWPHDYEAAFGEVVGRVLSRRISTLES